ncbi:MAG: hypothetical protein PHH37_00645 [Paludibacter sp.]|nr:hypothetical protein [Paludibacter sp.]
MKSKILPLILCCLLATSAYAHRDDYFGFTMGDNPGNDGWSISGGTGESIDGMYVVTATGGESVVWTRDLETQAGTKDQTYVSRAILQYVSGTGATNGTAHIVPKVILEGYNGETVTFTFKTAPDDDSKVISDTAAISDGAAFEGQVRYIKVIFENAEPNELISFSYIDLASQWFMPEVDVDKTIYIQAEDYDESWINNRKTHSSISGGNKYRSLDPDLYIDWQDDGAFFQSWTYGNGHKNNWYGFAVKNMCPNGATWNVYSGDYIDETSNKITVEDAKMNFGAWLEYTFDVPEACVADISLKAGSHWGAYGGVSGGTGKYGLPREDGGYSIDGMSEDWVKHYAASAVLSLDGNNLTTNWASYPKNEGLSQLEYAALASDPSLGWASTQVTKDGALVNSDTLHIFPNPLAGDPSNPMVVWSTYYKSDLFTDLQTNTGDPTLADYIKPDYANVYLSAGRHTIKVQSLAPMWHFDEMKIEAKEFTDVKNIKTNSSEKLIVYPSIVADVLHIKGMNVNYSIVNLESGAILMNGFGNTVDVSKLSAGVYAIRVGENIQRFIKK